MPTGNLGSMPLETAPLGTCRAVIVARLLLTVVIQRLIGFLDMRVGFRVTLSMDLGFATNALGQISILITPDSGIHPALSSSLVLVD